MVDVSGSVGAVGRQVQRDGYVAAFCDPGVARAIRSGGVGRVLVTYVEWAGLREQRVVMPWTVVASATDAAQFADALARQPVGRGRSTSISVALAFAARLFINSPVPAARRVIDISSDGPNNAGPPMTLARDVLVASGVTINGLPIDVSKTDNGPYSDPIDRSYLDRYYEYCVIGGKGAFAIAAHDGASFDATIRRKLVQEIADTGVAEHRGFAGCLSEGWRV